MLWDMVFKFGYNKIKIVCKLQSAIFGDING